MHLRFGFFLFAAASLFGQAPLQVARPLPPLLDLQKVDASQVVAKDARDPAQVEAARKAWEPLVAPFRHEPALRLRLPVDASRLPLLLAASQALKAQHPDQNLYVAFDAQAPALWEPSAWGAVQGGILTAEDLGRDPVQWRTRLLQAQNFLPGRPWQLWLPSDPGPLASALMGDGGHLVVPALGPAARLARSVPAGFTEVEGGPGDLTLRNGSTGQALRWRFLEGEWKASELPKERHEVKVEAQALYDVSALLARMRAAQLRDRMALVTCEARLDADVHVQSYRGMGGDLGFTFRTFEKAGETEELLQKEVRLNGVTANLHGGLQLPLVEARTSIAAPVALSLTERFRYEDGGPGERPGTRLLKFTPVGGEAQLPEGEVWVDEGTGRILQERSGRSDLPGVVKTERRVLTYGEPAPGLWRVVKIETFERWVLTDGVAQIQRHLAYRDFQVNDPGFEVRRNQARQSQGTMLKQTLNGLRYFNLQDDGARQVEEQPKTHVRALGAGLLVDRSLPLPVVPFGGLFFMDYNAFNKGLQLDALVAGIFNQVQISAPRLPGAFDLSFKANLMFLPLTERPVEQGRVLDREGVARQFGTLTLTVGRDLGLGFRAEAKGYLEYNRFSEGDKKYRTEGFRLPPSGWTEEWRGYLAWQSHGFQIRGYVGQGNRPAGEYGSLGNPQWVPDEGRFRRWGGSLAYDHRLSSGAWLHGEAGQYGGKGFDRFTTMTLGRSGTVPGIDSNAVSADLIRDVKVGVVLPPLAKFRLTLGLTHAQARNLDDHRFYGFTGLSVDGDIPGFWWFTAMRVNLGFGLQSDIPGARTLNGMVALMRVF